MARSDWILLSNQERAIIIDVCSVDQIADSASVYLLVKLSILYTHRVVISVQSCQGTITDKSLSYMFKGFRG
jgi:ribonucleotide reductase beta subunit family protein with ferritin-like domain